MQGCLSGCAFKLNICFQLLTWLMGMKWLESQWALSCHHVQNPRDGYVYAAWKCMISFARSGLWRSRWLSLSKFRHPQSELLAGFWAPAPVSPGVWDMESTVQKPIHTAPAWPGFCSQKNLGNMKPPFLMIAWNILQDTQISDSAETLTLIFVGCKPHFPFLAGKFC